MKNTRKPRQQLSHIQFYALCEFVRTSDLTALKTYTGIARAALDAGQTPFQPEIETVKRALEVTGTTFVSEKTKASVVSEDVPYPTAIIAMQVEALCKELGVQTIPAFRSLMRIAA